MRWKQFLTPVKSIDTRKARTMMDESPAGEMTVLDVRQPNEYEASHIPGARMIEFEGIDHILQVSSEEIVEAIRVFLADLPDD